MKIFFAAIDPQGRARDRYVVSMATQPDTATFKQFRADVRKEVAQHFPGARFICREIKIDYIASSSAAELQKAALWKLLEIIGSSEQNINVLSLICSEVATSLARKVPQQRKRKG